MKTFDFKKVAFIYAGRQITGFAEGSVIDVESDADDWALSKGADNEAMRTKLNNDAGRVTFRLQQTSESNRILSELRDADVRGTGGPAPMLLKDNSGTDLHSDDQAYILRRPNGSYGTEANEREWVLICPNMSSFFGGN